MQFYRHTGGFNTSMSKKQPQQLELFVCADIRRFSRIIDLWMKDGVSTAVIAEELHTTRNYVAGVLNRAGLFTVGNSSFYKLPRRKHEPQISTFKIRYAHELVLMRERMRAVRR